MEPAEKAFEIIEETPVYQGFFKMLRLRLRHTLFCGSWSGELTRELFHRGTCVAVIPYDPINDAVVLIKQFRVGALKYKDEPWLLEIVAGAVEEGESPEQVAHREALEEAGCELKQLIRIGEFFTSPGGSSEKITLFCGIVDTDGLGGLHGLAEEDEDIRVDVMEFGVAWTLFENGVIDSAIPIVALQWLAMNRERLREAHGAD
ncbi:MAG: NUDIX domain-containing protein [Methylococcaceae bacterium]|nr:NUDIX domain-containing protein [Methylococcaceae bacterium]